MRTSLHAVAISILIAWLGSSGVAAAAGCSPHGTWLNVNPGTHELAGFLSTISGQSNNEGTLVVENPGFGLTWFDSFPDAVAGSVDRGVWKRTGGRTFKYSLMGTAVDSNGVIVWIRRIDGTITMTDDCKTQKITAVMAAFLGTDDPFEGKPLFEVDFGDLYTHRLDLP
jgi:hypothetical protein